MFDIFYRTITLTANCNIIIFSSIKTFQSIKLFSTIRNLSCYNLVCNIEKSKAEIEFAFLRLLSLFIAPIASLL